MTSCTSPSIHCPPPVVFVLPLIPEAVLEKAEGGLATVGRLKVYLKGGSVASPEEGVAGWFSSSFGMFRKKTEKFTAREFLEKYSRFLSDTSLRNILLVEIDYTMVYHDRKQENPDDLDAAVRPAYEYLDRHRADSNKIVLSAVGKTNMGLENNLELHVETQFLRTHGFGKPSIEIDIVGIPSAFVRQDKENEQQYETRLKELIKELEDDAREEEIRKAHEETMRTILTDYKQHLAGLFEVERVTEDMTTRPVGYAD